MSEKASSASGARDKTKALAAGAQCGKCPYARERVLYPEPTAEPLVVVVGDNLRRAEVGAGKVGGDVGSDKLRRGLKVAAGIEPDRVHFTNAVICRGDERELTKAVKCCAPRLQTELRELKTAGARAIVPLGSRALNSVLGPKPKGAKQRSLMRFRGSVTEATGALSGLLVLPTLHPSTVWRMPKWERTWELDIIRIGRVLREGYRRPEDAPDRTWEVARTIKQLKKALARLGPQVAFDLETVGLGPTTTRLVCFAISDGWHTVVVPWSHDLAGLQPWWAVPAKVGTLVTAAFAERVVVAHNGPAFDFVVAARYGIHVARWEDTLNAAHVTDSHLPKKLEFLVGRWLDAPAWKHDEHGTSIELMHFYNMRDALYTALIAPHVLGRVESEGLVDVYRSDKFFAEFCREMQENGFPFDLERANDFATYLWEREQWLENDLCFLLGRDFKPFSAKDLRKAFAVDLMAPIVQRSQKTGAASYNVNAMRSYAAGSDERLAEFALKILELRRLRKVRVTYIQNLKVNPDGAIHPSWLSYGTVSGRPSCQAPNLANLPRGENDPLGHLGGIRSLYISCQQVAKGLPPTHAIVYFDVSQIEMRMAAYYSGDEAMITACNAQDMHAANAEAIFEDAFRAADPATRKILRSIAKQSGFAICYMAEAETVYARIVATGTPVTLRQVQVMLRKIKRRFAAYYEFQHQRWLDAVRTGFVYAPISGRRRWVGHDPGKPECANFPIQSGAAALMTRRLEEISKALRVEFPSARPVAQVYDSACYLVEVEHAEAMQRRIKEIFEAPIEINGRMAIFPIDQEIMQRWH